MEFLTDPQLLIAFLTLTALELVLGIDNVIFISILVDKLPPEKRAFARRLGLFLAMFMRIGLLMILSWLAGLTEPMVTVLGHGFSGRDLILLAGGLFLVWKSTQEVHQLMEGEEGEASSAVKATFGAVIAQIIVIDIVFSLDSVITAVGMVDHLAVMMAAVATDDPLMAAKPPQAATDAMASPPRKWPSHARPAANSSRLMPDLDANAPIRMNMGMTLRL